MDPIYNKKLIAFQTVDIEGDIWCNEALLFESEEEVKLFFENPEKVIKVLKLETTEEEGEMINNFVFIFSKGGIITAVRINLEYCGEKWIKRMEAGYIIKNI